MTVWSDKDYLDIEGKFHRKFGEPISIKDTSSWVSIMQMCIKHGVKDVVHDRLGVMAFSRKKTGRGHYSDHNNDMYLSERVARVIALVEV